MTYPCDYPHPPCGCRCLCGCGCGCDHWHPGVYPCSCLPDAHYSLSNAPIPGFPLDTHYSPPDAAVPVTAPAFSPSGFPPGDSYSLPDGATSVPMSAAVSVPMPMSTFPLSGPNISSQGSGALEEQTRAAIDMIQVSYHLYNGLNY